MLLAGGPDFEEPQTRRCVSLPRPGIYWRLKLAWYAPRVGSYFVWGHIDGVGEGPFATAVKFGSGSRPGSSGNRTGRESKRCWRKVYVIGLPQLQGRR